MAIILRNLRTTCLRSFLTCSSMKRGYADAPTTTKDMDFTMASANQVFYNSVDIKQVDVPTFSGSFGILPKHVPTLAVLKPGVVTVQEKDGSLKKIFVSSGTVCVNEDSSVQVLAEEAHLLENLDAAAARDALSQAQSELSSATGEARDEAAIAVEVAEAIVKAVQ